MIKRRPLFLFPARAVAMAIAVALLLATAPSGAEAPPATTTLQPDAAAQPVARLQDTLIVVMKQGKRLGYAGRCKKLDPVVRKAFDFSFIGRLILGSDWAGLSPDQQTKFVDALARLSVSTYAREFDAYSGQRFRYDGSRAMAGGKLERYVFTSGKDKYHFDYQMHQTDGAWKIANVVVNGVSDLALKRGQYRKLFSKKGYDGVMAWVGKQITANAAGKTS